MKSYQIQKRDLLQQWMKKCCINHIQLWKSNDLVRNWTFSDELKKFLRSNSEEETIYLMVAEITETDVIPLYIGKSKALYERWKAHLAKFFKAKPSYVDWNEVLIENGKFKYNVDLFVVPASKITIPPIPYFPKTVGSVEYQLIGLASDAHPEYLLNKEGNRR